MSQRLTSDHFPYLPISVRILSNSHETEALLDTGFDGDVILPAELVTDGEVPDWHVTCRLADGSEVLAPVYAGAVRVGLVDISPILVMIMGDEPLVGRSVVEHFSVTLDHGRRVIVDA